MKKSIFYLFFLIILPISFGSSENTGCNLVKKTDKKEQTDKTSQSRNPSSDQTFLNSQE